MRLKLEGLGILLLTLAWIFGTAYLMDQYKADASDKKEFGEALGSIGRTTVYHFETPSAQCFTYAGTISCVANK